MQPPVLPPVSAFVAHRRAVVLMALATLAFAGMGAVMKILREAGMATSTVVFWRFAIGVPVAAWVVHRRGFSLRLRRPDVMAARCAFGLAAAMGSFFAVRTLSLAQHSTLHLLQPVFVAALAPFLLAERLHRSAALALVLALAGALAVIEPTGAIVRANGWPVLAAVAAALASACAHMSVRKATRTDPPALIVLYFAVVASLFGLAWTLCSNGVDLLLPGMTIVPASGAILTMAVLGLSGQYLMTYAYAQGQAPPIAMVGYAAIPLGFLLDVAVWSRGASALALAGGASMALAGVVLYRGRSEQPILDPEARPR